MYLISDNRINENEHIENDTQYEDQSIRNEDWLLKENLRFNRKHKFEMQVL